jgi:hypothetical protein
MLQRAFMGRGIDVTPSGVTVPHVPAATAKEAVAIAFRRVNERAYPLWLRYVTRITVTAERGNPLNGAAEVTEAFIPRPEVARIKNWTSDEVERQLRATKFQGERLVLKHQSFWRERDIS